MYFQSMQYIVLVVELVSYIFNHFHRWEQGQSAWREEQRQERKQEIQNIRSRLFLVGSHLISKATSLALDYISQGNHANHLEFCKLTESRTLGKFD